MSETKAAFIAAVLSFFLSSVGCSGSNDAVNNSNANSNSNTPSNNRVAAKDSVEELGMLIKLPYEAIETYWIESLSSKQGYSRQLTAVIRFSAADANKLAADAAKLTAPVPHSVELEDWFPTELVTKSEMTGDPKLAGRSYSAAAFFQEPYIEGRLTRIDETDFFVVELSAK